MHSTHSSTTCRHGVTCVCRASHLFPTDAVKCQTMNDQEYTSRHHRNDLELVIRRLVPEEWQACRRVEEVSRLFKPNAGNAMLPMCPRRNVYRQRCTMSGHAQSRQKMRAIL